jgi:hypothetical protein
VLSNVILVGDKRKYLSALMTLKTMMTIDGAPTHELTPECISVFAANGILMLRSTELLLSLATDA